MAAEFDLKVKGKSMASTVFKNGQVTEEEWVTVSPDEPLPAGKAIVVSFTDFLADAKRFLESSSKIGVALAPADDAKELEPYLNGLSLVAVDFPQFTDGRGFSSARVLREQLGFEGEIRATGAFILDQVSMLKRCGVDSFAPSNEVVLRGLLEGSGMEVTLYSQPSISPSEQAVKGRPWLRRETAA
ncbi:DUF934 domain-containing protein [Rhodobacteraceae bacterium RKSG542]|uniref:DUF934 domain-containing protein n=1 Tax=Pseudovibrio flavus TaxID=2529854 RepID=UPI0012BCD360|nr:DUF934 domain-containing protein [Pseudovibrio flavus]MTI17080.1 DUF934 domain-containing protein [Pseudovibrio flavus]